MSLEAILDRVAEDNKSGASITMDYVIEDLIGVLNQESGLDREAMESFALRLYGLRSTMAPVFHLSNLILLACESVEPELPDRLRTALTGMRDRERRSSSDLAKNAASSLSGSRFLTLSSSGTVNLAVLELNSRRKIEMVVMESLPGGEGRHNAELLSANGIAVDLIRDSMVFDRAKGCDAGLCGADSISPAGVVNKVGTFSLASACAEVGIPCYLLATWGKCMPFPATDKMCTERVISKIRYSEQVFETVPLSRFGNCINERGAISVEEMLNELRKMPLAEAWRKRS